MIKHIVMWTLKEQSDGRNKAENAQLLKKKLEELFDAVPELRSIEVGLNIAQSDAAFDVVLVSEFDSPEDLATYQTHPAHEAVKSFVAAIRDKRAVVDYEG